MSDYRRRDKCCPRPARGCEPALSHASRADRSRGEEETLVWVIRARALIRRWNIPRGIRVGVLSASSGRTKTRTTVLDRFGEAETPRRALSKPSSSRTPFFAVSSSRNDRDKLPAPRGTRSEKPKRAAVSISPRRTRSVAATRSCWI